MESKKVISYLSYLSSSNCNQFKDQDIRLNEYGPWLGMVASLGNMNEEEAAGGKCDCLLQSNWDKESPKK